MLKYTIKFHPKNLNINLYYIDYTHYCKCCIDNVYTYGYKEIPNNKLYYIIK